MNEENKQDSVTENSVAKRLYKIEKALERIEKSQDDQKESMKTQADLELQIGSAKLQQSIAKSQMTHEDMTVEQFKMVVDQFKFDLYQAKANIFVNIAFTGMWATSIGFAILAIGATKNSASFELLGFIFIYIGAAFIPIFYLYVYIKKIMSRKIAQKREAKK